MDVGVVTRTVASSFGTRLTYTNIVRCSSHDEGRRSQNPPFILIGEAYRIASRVRADAGVIVIMARNVLSAFEA